MADDRHWLQVCMVVTTGDLMVAFGRFLSGDVKEDLWDLGMGEYVRECMYSELGRGILHPLSIIIMNRRDKFLNRPIANNTSPTAVTSISADSVLNPDRQPKSEQHAHSSPVMAQEPVLAQPMLAYCQDQHRGASSRPETSLQLHLAQCS